MSVACPAARNSREIKQPQAIDTEPKKSRTTEHGKGIEAHHHWWEVQSRKSPQTARPKWHSHKTQPKVESWVSQDTAQGRESGKLFGSVKDQSLKQALMSAHENCTYRKDWLILQNKVWGSSVNQLRVVLLPLKRRWMSWQPNKRRSQKKEFNGRTSTPSLSRRPKFWMKSSKPRRLLLHRRTRRSKSCRQSWIGWLLKKEDIEYVENLRKSKDWLDMKEINRKSRLEWDAKEAEKANKRQRKQRRQRMPRRQKKSRRPRRKMSAGKKSLEKTMKKKRDKRQYKRKMKKIISYRKLILRSCLMCTKGILSFVHHTWKSLSNIGKFQHEKFL